MLSKKTSRAIAFLTTMLVLTGGLAGCKGNPEPANPSSSGSNPGSFSASSDAAAPSGGDTTSPEQTPGTNASGTSSTSSNRTNKPNGTTSNNGGNNTPGSNTVKGTVTLMIAADAEKETAAMLNVFKKKYPQVTLKTQVEGATNTIGQDLSKLSAAKKLPDVVLFGTENFAYIMSQGLAYPLDKLYAADPDKGDAFQAGIENYTYFNHLYALPFRLQFNTIGVNTDLFETLNLKDPGYNWTIAQFVDMAKKATTITYSGINYIFDSGDPTHGLDIGLMNSLLPDGFGLYGYNMKNNTFNFTNGAWVKAKEVCKNLTNTPGLVADDLKKTSSGGKTAYEQKFGSGGDAMKAGKVLFTNTHSWQASWYDEVKHNWDFYPYPRKDDKTNQRIQTHVDFVCMTTAVTQANRDAAYALLKTLSYDKDAAIEYVKYCESQYASTKKRTLLTPASAHPDVIAYYSKSKVYHADQNVVLDSTMTVAWTGCPAVKTAVYSLWQDETKEYALDRYGNEVTSPQTTLDTPVEDYVRDSTSMDAAPVLFSLEAGRQTVQVCSDNQAIHLYRFRVVRQPSIPTAEEYRVRHDGPAYTGAPVIVEGEDYAVKSDSFIRSKAESNSGVYPYSPYYKWMATVDGVSWNAVGQRVLWNITVPQDGWYQVAFHYSQSSQEGQEIYRTLEIDGQIPADSFREMPFSYTGSPYAYNMPQDALWLTKGRHTLGMMAESSQTATLVDDVQTLMEELSDIGLSLQQVAGSSADKNRSWDIETYIPGVIGHMRDIQSRLRTLYDTLEKQYGEVPANCLNLRLADDMIEQILKKPEKMPTRIEEISVGSGSITNLLVELVNKWKNQGLSLDRIYLMEKGTELPAANGSFWSNLINGVKRFFNALTSREANYSASATGDRQTLSVWVNRSVPYVETMQMLADSRYKGVDADGNPLSVQFSIMPDEGKLLLANASNTCPDVALSVTGDRAYQLGLRHAVAQLSDFPDFTGYITGKFLDSAFEPYLHDGRVYGLPETQDFYVLLYRRDILEKLKLQVPRTWSDLAGLMPALRRSGMNFYMPLSSQTGTKSLSYIAPFYFQAAIANGENPDYSLWSEDGTSVNFNNETGIRAFQELTDLYLLYGLQNNMPSFYNNFRYGVTPLGIGSFANYVQLLYAAPEIAGQWGVAPALGFTDEKGTLCNQMPSFDRSAIIMDSSLKKEAGWDFIKWWMSAETQAEFAQTLQAKFGSEFVWNSANLEAFAQLAIPSADREVILQQWENAVNLRYLPATYMLERSLSDAWYTVTQGQQSVRIALNEAAVSVEQELILKLQEFGYLNDAEEPIKPYDMRQWAVIRQDLFRE